MDLDVDEHNNNRAKIDSTRRVHTTRTRSSSEAMPATAGTSASPVSGPQQHTRRLSLSTGLGKHPAPYRWTPRLKSSLFGAVAVAASALLWDLLLMRRRERTQKAAAPWTRGPTQATTGLRQSLADCDTRLLCEILTLFVLVVCMCKVAVEDRLALVVRRKLRYKLEDSFKHRSWVEAAWVRAGWETKVVVGVAKVSASLAATLATEEDGDGDGAAAADDGGCGGAAESALDAAGPTLLAVRNIALVSLGTQLLSHRSSM